MDEKMPDLSTRVQSLLALRGRPVSVPQLSGRSETSRRSSGHHGADTSPDVFLEMNAPDQHEHRFASLALRLAAVAYFALLVAFVLAWRVS